MTRLHSTELTTPQKIELTTKAIANDGNYGAITQLSDEYKVSRSTIYSVKNSVKQGLNQYFEQKSDHNLVIVDNAQLERAIVALRVVAPNSIRAIQTLLPLLYPGTEPSYGVIQRVSSEAEQAAKQYNEKEDLSNIANTAVDEMYSQGFPVLAGIDLDSGYLPALKLRDSRGKDDWVAVLEEAKQKGLDMKIVVKDAAPGIAAGVAAVYPNAEQRDDCFHVLYDTNKVKRKLRGLAYNAIESEHKKSLKLEKIHNKIKNKGKLDALQQANVQKDRKTIQKAYDAAKIYAVKTIKQYDDFEKANRLIRESMMYVSLQTPTLYSGDEIKDMMIEAATILEQIDHKATQKLSTYINNRAQGLSLATSALHTKLTQVVNSSGIKTTAMACQFIRLHDELSKMDLIRPSNAQWKQLNDLYPKLRASAGDKLIPLVNEIQALLEKRYRASSAIEGFNATLRPYLYVHKGVTQNFLELFKAYYNLRTRRWGRHKGTSAHECLNGVARTDWLSELGYKPSAPVALAA